MHTRLRYLAVLLFLSVLSAACSTESRAAVTTTTTTTHTTTTTTTTVPRTTTTSTTTTTVVLIPPITLTAAPTTIVATTSDGWHADGYDWMALAMCETHQDWTMHGDVYATAFGISTGASELTDAARNGTASPEEQLHIAIAVERRAGIDSWGCAAAAKGG